MTTIIKISMTAPILAKTGTGSDLILSRISSSSPWLLAVALEGLLFDEALSSASLLSSVSLLGVLFDGPSLSFASVALPTGVGLLLLTLSSDVSQGRILLASTLCICVV